MAWILMSKDVTQDRLAPAWPGGVACAALDPARAAQAHRLLAQGYAQGGAALDPFELWWPRLVADDEFDLSLCFAATVSSGEIVGLAQCWTSAFVKDLAVRADWRRRGVGEALLRHAFGVFRDRGAAAVALKVDAGNAAALRLYRRVGMLELERGD